MSLADAELIVDRRRLRRKLRLWRVVAVLFVLIAVGAIWFKQFSINEYRDHIARIHITGMITDDRKTLDLIDDVAKSGKAKAVIVRIDSPGGTTEGSEAVYEHLRRLAAKKPVVATMGALAASGGYVAAIAADYIVARGNTLTGSIGVIFSMPEISQLLEKLGVKMEELKSGELKAEPNFFKPISPKVRSVTNELIMDSFDWFVGLVAERRGLPLDQVKLLADGRVYTGRQALKVKLVDAIGGEEVALAWLEKEKNITNTPVVDWRVREELSYENFVSGSVNMILKVFGFESVGAQLARNRLGGLLAVWHAQL